MSKNLRRATTGFWAADMLFAAGRPPLTDYQDTLSNEDVLEAVGHQLHELFHIMREQNDELELDDLKIEVFEVEDRHIAILLERGEIVTTSYTGLVGMCAQLITLIMIGKVELKNVSTIGLAEV